MTDQVLNNPVIVAEPTKKEEKPKKPKSLPRKIIGWVLYIIFGAFFALIIAGNISGEIHKKENFGQSIRFGYGSFIVLTNSMEPEIPVDSAIITHKDNVESLYQRFIDNETYNEAIYAREALKPEAERDYSDLKNIDITFANINSGVSYIPKYPDFNPAINPDARPIFADRIMTHRLREMAIDEEKELGKGRYIFVTSGINDGGDYSKRGQYQVFTEKEYLGTVVISNQFLGKVFNFIVSPIGLLVLLLVPAIFLIVTSTIDIFKAMKQSEEENAVLASASSGENRINAMSEKQKELLKKQLLEEIKQKRKEREKHEE